MGRPGLRSGGRTAAAPPGPGGGPNRSLTRMSKRRTFVCQRPFVVAEKEGGAVWIRTVPCEKEFKSRSSLCNHGRTSSSHGTFTCVACFRPFATAEKLARHQGIGSDLECMKDSCPICSKRGLGTIRLMQTHMNSFHRAKWEELNHRRRVVNAVSTARAKADEPTLSALKDCPRLQCPDCGATFAPHTNDRKRNLRLHMRDRCKIIDEDGIPTTKVCECGSSFTIKRFYFHHKKTMCAEDRPPDFVPSTTIDFTHPPT